MSPILKNILGLLAGIVAGSVVNMGLIMLGPTIIPPPEGVNPADMESVRANVHLYDFKHWVIPFLAHALGTLVGAIVAVKICATRHKLFALVVGAWFLLGGIVAGNMLGTPMSYNIVDWVGAYIPMALLGWSIAKPKN